MEPYCAWCGAKLKATGIVVNGVSPGHTYPVWRDPTGTARWFDRIACRDAFKQSVKEIGRA